MVFDGRCAIAGKRRKLFHVKQLNLQTKRLGLAFCEVALEFGRAVRLHGAELHRV